MRVFTRAAVSELAELLAGREPQWLAEPALEPGTMLWTRDSIPIVLVAPDVLSLLNNAIAVEHAVQARLARALDMQARHQARVYA